MLCSLLYRPPSHGWTKAIIQLFSPFPGINTPPHSTTQNPTKHPRQPAFPQRNLSPKQQTRLTRHDPHIGRPLFPIPCIHPSCIHPPIHSFNHNRERVAKKEEKNPPAVCSVRPCPGPVPICCLPPTPCSSSTREKKSSQKQTVVSRFLLSKVVKSHPPTHGRPSVASSVFRRVGLGLHYNGVCFKC